jgi:hypothetical protein
VSERVIVDSAAGVPTAISLQDKGLRSTYDRAYVTIAVGQPGFNSAP